MIRMATSEDAERLLEMGERFAAETKYGSLVGVSKDRIRQVVLWVLENPDGAIFVSGNDPVTGMIALLCYDHQFSGERTAFEIVWWVDPEARGDGVRLLREAEKWAKDSGAKAIQMVAPNERVGSFYERLGYTPVETSYQRSL